MSITEQKKFVLISCLVYFDSFLWILFRYLGASKFACSWRDVDSHIRSWGGLESDQSSLDCWAKKEKDSKSKKNGIRANEDNREDEDETIFIADTTGDHGLTNGIIDSIKMQKNYISFAEDGSDRGTEEGTEEGSDEDSDDVQDFY